MDILVKIQTISSNREKTFIGGYAEVGGRNVFWETEVKPGDLSIVIANNAVAAARTGVESLLGRRLDPGDRFLVFGGVTSTHTI